MSIGQPNEENKTLSYESDWICMTWVFYESEEIRCCLRGTNEKIN